MKEEVTVCDVPGCNGGSSHFSKCGNGHDICGCCSFEMKATLYPSGDFPKESGGEFYCPICVDLEKGRIL